MKKRFLAVLLSLCMVFTLLSGTALAGGAYEDPYPVIGGNIYFDPPTGMVVGSDLEVTRADIPDTINGVAVTGIGVHAFSNCSNLTSLTIPDSVTSIEYSAFSGCASLTSVIIPEGVTSIGDRAFSGCTSLTTVTIPEGVTSIGEDVFFNCSSLTSVTIPSSVTSIEDYAFEGCESLTSVTIPSSVTSIGDSAFSGCTGLTTVTIPEGVTSIGEDVFYNCSSMTSVTIPSSVISIGDGAFSGCARLTDIAIDANNSSYTSIDCVLFNKDCTILLQYPAAKDEISYVIPDSVTSIGNYAFSGCTSLTSISIPDSVTSIGVFAFDSCTSLASATIPNSVTSIGNSAFSGCTSLTSIIIPNGVADIGWYGFLFCTSLTSVFIPNSVTSIGTDAFAFCFGLTDVYYGGSEADWNAIEIGDENESLLNATIHYNSAAPAPSVPTTPVTPIPPVGTAYATTYSILVDGKPVAFDAYALRDENNNDTNYLKLRDVAHVLNGSAAQFNVGWDASTGSISLTTGAAYTTPNGSEMSTPFSGNQPYRVSAAAILVNGVQADLSAITLTDANGGDYTYFKLRDLGKYLGFDVDWDNDARAIVIDTTRPYSE